VKNILEDVAIRNFIFAQPEEIMFGAIGRMWKAGDDDGR
jgi:hypothetical protein